MPPAKKKAKLDHGPDLSWINTEVTRVEEITPTHRRRAAGLTNIQTCKFSPFPPPGGDGIAESSSAAAARTKSDAGCTAKACKGSIRCYNHLGVDQTIGENARQEFLESKVDTPPEHRSDLTPAGLRNMGALCYLATYLQLWFHNTAFRNALYRCHIKEGSKLGHLVKLFAAMQYSERKVIDPSALVEALGLRTNDQQDAGEFSKLFLDLLRSELQRQDDPELRGLIERLGKLENITTCSHCRYTSSRPETFLELPLSLKNNDTLHQRLTALQATEYLNGDNKYYCSRCDDHRNATRRLEVTELPQYLNLSLMRFTYDMRDQERKKSKAVIKYPKSVTLMGFEYDLSAVVVHLGSSPYHGHFVTELYDEQTQKWFNCNDEEVTPRPATKKLTTTTDGHESSKDAYMLVYKKRTNPNIALNNVQPPETVMKEVIEDNKKIEQDIKEWEDKCELAGMEFETLRSIKEPVISALSGDEKIIPRDELKRWLEGDMDALSQPISYSSLSCAHFTDNVSPIPLDPTKMSDARLISLAAFRAMEFNTPIPEAEICPTCVEISFNTRQSALDRSDQVQEFDDLNTRRRPKKGPIDLSEDEVTYLISKSFIDAWKKNKLEPGTLPSDPGYSLYCGHDKPWPDNRPAIQITPEALQLLHSALGGDFQLFTTSEPLCCLCSTSTQAEIDNRESWLIDLKAEKLIKREINPMTYNYHEKYYVLSRIWYDQWRNYLISPSNPKPIYISEFCIHGGLIYDPGVDEAVDHITQHGWNILQERYGPQIGASFKYSDKDVEGARYAVYDVKPPVCFGCREERISNWDHMEVKIRLVENGDKGIGKDNSNSKPSSSSTASTSTLNILPAKRNRSSRSTTSKKKDKPHTFTIKPDTTVKELRSEIYDVFGISHIAQSIWFGNVELGDPEMTMKDVGMVIGGEVRVWEIKEKDDNEEGDGGFGGTALGGFGWSAGNGNGNGDGLDGGSPIEMDDKRLEVEANGNGISNGNGKGKGKDKDKEMEIIERNSGGKEEELMGRVCKHCTMINDWLSGEDNCMMCTLPFDS